MSTPPATPAPDAPAKTSAVMTFIKWTLLLLVLVVGGFLGYVSTLPDDFTVSRSIVVDAPAAEVFPWVNNLHKSHEWSPWTKLDPKGKFTFEGPDEGKGAIFSWEGNDKMGAGRLTITDSLPNEQVTMKLEFKRPMEDTSTAKYILAPQGEKTNVTWTMSGKYANIVGKAICCLMNMDKVVGTQFEEGLSNLKTKVATASKGEAEPKAEPVTDAKEDATKVEEAK